MYITRACKTTPSSCMHRHHHILSVDSTSPIKVMRGGGSLSHLTYPLQARASGWLVPKAPSSTDKDLWRVLWASQLTSLMPNSMGEASVP